MDLCNQSRIQESFMKKKKRLIWQLYPSYLLIILLSLVAVSWYASRSFHQFFLDQTMADLKTRTQLLEKQISQYISLPGSDLPDRACKEIGAYAQTRITVILPDGKVIADSEEIPGNMDNHGNRPEVISAGSGQTGTAIRYSKTLQQRMMYVAAPLKMNNRVRGILRTSIPLTSIDNKLKSIRIRITLGGVFIALLASGICYYVSRRISRPIEDMKKGAEHFARGELEHRLASPNTKELGSLAEAMNQMAFRLQERIETVINQRNEYEAVLSSMEEGVIAVDMEEHILSINHAAFNMLGISLPSVKGRSIQEIIRNRELHSFVEDTLSSGKTAGGDIVLHQNGERILNVCTTPLCNSSEKRIGTLVVLNDVTHLRHLENVRTDFAANVSHEIRTPLTAIKGFVETLLGCPADDPEESRRFLGIIEKHVSRLAAIIEDLLLLSRVEQEDKIMQIQLQEGPVKDIILSSVQVCQAKADEKQIQIKLLCDGELIAQTEPRLIEQAVINLLDNAIKYSHEQSEVLVETLRTDSDIIIRIQDSGIGIEKKHLPRLFERFYRIDRARSRKLGGTGLGLAIVKHITQAHKGHVAVESVPGKGSTFEIRLPLF